MNLHHNQELFDFYVSLTVEEWGMTEEAIRADYWMLVAISLYLEKTRNKSIFTGDFVRLKVHRSIDFIPSVIQVLVSDQTLSELEFDESSTDFTFDFIQLQPPSEKTEEKHVHTYIYEMLLLTGRHEEIDRFGLRPFSVLIEL